MTIIIFLIDTSGTMNQRTYLGTSILDVAKCAVEYFMKIRSRDPNSRLDRYMLLTYEEPPSNIKAGWKESHATFISELKNLKASGMTTLGPSLKYAFDLLNVNRMQSGIDTYGQGRSPFYLEPAVIISLTDGCHFSNMAGIQNVIQLPMDAAMVPGSELTKEPFRWDQRLFSLILRIPAIAPDDSTTAPATSPLDSMSSVTGGQAYTVISQKGLNQCLESLVHRCQSGVVINFELSGPAPTPQSPVKNEPVSTNQNESNSDASTQWHNTRKLIYVTRTGQKGLAQGHWPIPESFWPDVMSTSLPARQAHPIIHFKCDPYELNIIDQLPFDKYELEPSPLTQYILERRQPNIMWQVFVKNSGKTSELTYPFGYLKASTNLQYVNLVIMPYNYPVLMGILDELVNQQKLRPTMNLRSQFDAYLATIPAYYITPLRRALARMSIHNLIPDTVENCLSYCVISYLKRLKNQAKIEFDKIVSTVGQTVPISTITRLVSALNRTPTIDDALRGVDAKESIIDFFDKGNFALTVNDNKTSVSDDYSNPFDIPRSRLLNHIYRLRSQIHSVDVGSFGKHNIAVGQMGNYQEVVRCQTPPLRSIGNQPARINTFGNPFKVNKNLLSVDEADEAVNCPDAQFKKRKVDSANPKNDSKKRKAGPLSREICYRDLLSPRADRFPETSPIYDSEPELSSFDCELIIDDEDIKMNSSDEAEDIEQDKDDINISAQFSDEDEKEEDIISEDELPEIETEPSVDDDDIKENGDHSFDEDGLLKPKYQQLEEIVIKRIRSPGQPLHEILKFVQQYDSCKIQRLYFIKRMIHEAFRFKRKTIITELESIIKLSD